MITKEAIEAAALSDAAFDGRRFDGLSAADKRRYRERSAAALTAAIEAIPGPAVKVKPQTDEEVQQWIEACNHEPARDTLRHYLELRRILSALTPAPDLASENERLRAALVKSIVTAACELDGPADPADDDTICINFGDLEAIVERHVTAALERT